MMKIHCCLQSNGIMKRISCHVTTQVNKSVVRPYLSSSSSRTCTITADNTVREANCASKKPFSEIPGPKGLPYLGTLHQYRKGPLQKYDIDRYQSALLSRYKEYGNIMKETIAGVTAVRVFDPDFVRVVFQNEGKIPHVFPLLESTKQYRAQKNMSPGLGNTNGEEWYRLRSAVQQMMMRPKEVTVYLPLIQTVADDFMQTFDSLRNKEGTIKDFKRYLSRWNLETSGMTCFETRLGCLGAGDESWADKMIKANNKIFELSTQLVFSVPFHKLVFTPKWKKLVEAEDFFFNNGQKLVDQTVKKIEELSDCGQLKDGQYNFLTYLLSRKELSYKDVSIITLSLFGDGLNTTIPSFTFALYCIAKNPDVQQKVYNEICQVIPAGEPVSPEMIGQLTYMRAFMKEVFRLYPIGPEVKRIPQKDLVVGGYHIPAGTVVELCTNVLLKLPEHFQDPEKFMPERWLRDGSAQNIHPYLLTPFGHGPRMCAGRRFAEQEMNLLMIKILQKYSVEWQNEEELEQKFQMLMVPDKPANFTFINRS